MPSGISHAKYEIRILECRGMLRHAWHWIPTPANERPKEGIAVWVRCERCTTERHDVVRFYDGSLLKRKYHYPDAYKGWGRDVNGDRITSEEIRRRYLEILQRNKKNGR